MVTYIDKKKSAACDSGIQALAYAFIAKFGSLKKAPEGRIAVALGATETVNQHEPAGELQDHWLCPEGNKYEQIHCSSRTFFFSGAAYLTQFFSGVLHPRSIQIGKATFFTWVLFLPTKIWQLCVFLKKSGGDFFLDPWIP